MNTLEEFFKNRISFNVKEYYNAVSLGFDLDCLADVFTYNSIIHNPQSLNIKNTFDLVEKLTPLLYYILNQKRNFRKIGLNFQRLNTACRKM